MDRSSSGGGLGPRHDTSSRIAKPESSADKLAALKARVAAAIDTSKAKGGLNVGLHPALENLSSWKPPSSSSSPPAGGGSSYKSHKDSYSQRNQQRPDHSKPGPVPRIGDGKSNPYFDDSQTSQPTGGGGRGREARQLVFNQKGKYIAQANALRRQAALDAMRQRIAEQTRKAGIDDDTDVEKKFLIEEPPEIEWWDEGLINGKNYDSIDDPNILKIGVPDSIITEYIQHPIALEPPQDRQAPAPKPMFLTSKEQAKLRRQRRMADLKEMQAKIRLGLVPAPPPKVKKGNLMRVLGDGTFLQILVVPPPPLFFVCFFLPARLTWSSSCCQGPDRRRSPRQPRDRRTTRDTCQRERRAQAHQGAAPGEDRSKPAKGRRQGDPRSRLQDQQLSQRPAPLQDRHGCGAERSHGHLRHASETQPRHCRGRRA